MKKMYENLTDKKVIIDCGKELNRWKIQRYDYQPNAFINSNGWTKWYKQTLLNTNESDWTLVGWNRKVESIND